MLIENVTLRRIACLGLLSVLLGAPSWAFAQEPSEETQAEAKARLQQGAKAYSKGRYKDAVDAFLSANELVPSPMLSFNIAKAYEKLRDSAAALNWYRDYLRRAPGAPDRADVERLVTKYEAVLRDRGVQQVTVLSTPEGATVVLDGEPVGVTPWTGEKPPGKHIATLQLRGYADAVEQFELAADHAMDVSVELETAQDAKPESAATERSEAAGAAPVVASSGDVVRDEQAADNGVRAPTWIAFGLGGAALGTALGFEMMRQSAEQDARDAPTQVDAKDAFNSMENHQTTSRILAGVGGVALLAGTILLYFDLSRGDDEAATQTALAGGCAPAGCALVLSGSL